ncbi:MAG: LuxR C-terminal-related transcriptional regulator [Chloroflexota bacterium]
MPQPLLATKTFVPRRRPQLVPRPRLHGRLNQLDRYRLVLLCAPAGFGKTTLITDWIAERGAPAAWLSLDEGDADPARFLAYLVAAVRTILPEAGGGVLAMLGAPQPPAIDAAMTSLINDVTAATTSFVLVLDDLHAVDSPAADAATAFLVEHMPSAMHLVIATREDPALPLARLRARDDVLELRAADLRFTLDESQAFLEGPMALTLSRTQVQALESTTEGWIAGLQLAAVSLRDEPDPDAFIASFSGSHRFVLDYLLEEVLDRQPPGLTRFLLETSVLDRLCGPLCDAVTLDPGTPGQDAIEQLERANLFIVPLDDERRWYRYHHLFRDLLRQRLGQRELAAEIDERHLRASRWYEANGLDVEAFTHAAAGHDIDRAERLVEGGGLPLYVRGALAPILSWLRALPQATFDERPRLRATYATVLLASGVADGVDEMLDRAELELTARGGEGATHTLANIAITRSLLALSQHRADLMISESERALSLLPESASVARSTVLSTLGYAYEVLGERARSRRCYQEALTASRAAGNRFGEMAALTGLGSMQALDNELGAATATYEEAIRQAADMQYPVISEAYLGLARIAYERNDLPRARDLGAISLDLGRRLQADRFVVSLVLLARISLAEGDTDTAFRTLDDAEAAVREHGFAREAPNVAAARVQVLLRENRVEEAAGVASTIEDPLTSARVLLRQGDTAAALATLRASRERAEARGWADDRLRAVTLEAVALEAAGSCEEAGRSFAEIARVVEPEGFVRLFLDEGLPMAQLLRRLASAPGGDFAGRLLGILRASARGSGESAPNAEAVSALPEPLTPREVELLGLIADGLTNAQIAERLFLSPHTVKVHTRNIYAKLQAESRTQAVAVARRLGVLAP